MNMSARQSWMVADTETSASPASAFGAKLIVSLVRSEGAEPGSETTPCRSLPVAAGSATVFAMPNAPVTVAPEGIDWAA